MTINDSVKREPLPLGKSRKALDIISFARRYGLFILLLGGFLFTMLTPFIFVVKKPYYEVHALMRVDPIVPTVLTANEESSIVNYYDRYANTAAQSMTTIDILQKSLEAMEPAKRAELFPAAMHSSTCAAILQQMVVVNPIHSTHILDISISGSKPEGLAEFVNTLMQVYMEETRKTNNNSNADRLRFLYAQKNVITQEMSDIERDLDSLTRDIGTSSFSEMFNIAGKNSDNLLHSYNNALTERVSAETNLRAIKYTNSELRTVTLDPLVNEVVLGNNALTHTDSWTYQQLQELRSTTDGLTEINPERIYVEERMKSMKSYAQELREEIRSKAQQIFVGKRDIEMKKSLIMAKSTYNAAKAKEDSLKQALNANLKESKRISIGIHRGEYLSANWQNKFDLLNNIEKRITEIEIEKKAPLRLSTLSIARTPNQPLKSNVNNIMMMMGIGSFALIGGAFFIYELLDETIRSEKDITHALGYPPVQTIVDLSFSKDNDELYSIAPKNFRAHQIGSLAVKFMREKELQDSRIILFTGTDKGVGASSITVSCAKALAQLAPKVLIIDGDIETGPLEESEDFQFSLPGLCDYLCGKTTLDESIITTPGDNIDMMYAGNIAGDTIPRQKIQAMLKELKTTYDFICIDTNPIMDSHLAEHLATHSDIVTLISLGDSSKFSALRKSAELLVRLGVPSIAPILNFGGIRQTLSIVEMFDNPPKMLKKLLPINAINTIKRYPSGLRLLDHFLIKVQQFQK